MCGWEDVWVMICGRGDVWCEDVWVGGCVGVRMFGCEDVWVPRRMFGVRM